MQYLLFLYPAVKLQILNDHVWMVNNSQNQKTLYESTSVINDKFNNDLIKITKSINIWEIADYRARGVLWKSNGNAMAERRI